MFFEEKASINFEEVLNVCKEVGLKVVGAILIVLVSVTFALMVWEFMKDVAAKSLELLGRNSPEVQDEILSPRPKRARSQRTRRGKSPKQKNNIKIISQNVNADSGDIGDVNG